MNLAEPVHIVTAKPVWLAALEEVDRFVRSRPAAELGCLYYSPARNEFVIPDSDAPLEEQGIVPHYGAPEGFSPSRAGWN